MTTDQAIKILEGAIKKPNIMDGYLGQALTMAINALKNQLELVNNSSKLDNENVELISRQAAIDALCAVCGNDCDKSKFVYSAPQDEQVILCPEHYCLCTLPSAQPKTQRLLDDGTLIVHTDIDIIKITRVNITQNNTHYGDLFYRDEE